MSRETKLEQRFRKAITQTAKLAMLLHLGAEVEREFDAAHWRVRELAFELDPDEENLDIVENRVETVLSKQVETEAMRWWSAFAWAELQNP